jgi:hypothetical protein
MIMKKLMCGVVAVCAVLGGASILEAQSPIPFAVEVRADAAFPTGGGFADIADTGVGFGVSASVQLVPNIGVYGSYSRFTFDLSGTDVPEGVRAVDSGFSVGLTTSLPALVPGLVPWVGAGLLIRDLGMEGMQTPAGDTGLGFEVGGGIAVPLAPRIRVTPGVGFRRYTAPLLADTETISYVTAGVGLNFAF